jgi:hypothetical membrane protein
VSPQADRPWNSWRTLTGAWLVVVGSAQFFVAMAVEQALRPGYFDVGIGSNTISDLGVNIHGWGYDWIFNGSVMALGIMGCLGIALLYPVFPKNGRTYPAAYLLGLGCLGAICIGIFTESSTAMNGDAHDFFSVWTFGFANIGLLAMGIAMWGDREWGRQALLTTALGALSVVALAIYIQNELSKGTYLGLGEGGLERVVAFPVLLWVIYVGALVLMRRSEFLAADHRAAPSSSVPSSS